MNQTTFSYVTKLPEVETSQLRELQWSIDHWRRVYAEAGAQAKSAWQLYTKAIDDGEPREHKDALFEMWKMFDANRVAAWKAFDEVKAQYLALLN
jgi:hypothetical protein